MSKSTLRKRIAITAISALFAGTLSIATVPSANAGLHLGIVGTGATNPDAADAGNTTLLVATIANTTGGARSGHQTSTGGSITTTAVGSMDDNALST